LSRNGRGRVGGDGWRACLGALPEFPTRRVSRQPFDHMHLRPGLSRDRGSRRDPGPGDGRFTNDRRGHDHDPASSHRCGIARARRSASSVDATTILSGGGSIDRRLTRKKGPATRPKTQRRRVHPPTEPRRGAEKILLLLLSALVLTSVRRSDADACLDANTKKYLGGRLGSAFPRLCVFYYSVATDVDFPGNEPVR